MRIYYVCGDRGVPLDGRKGASAHVRGLVGAFRRLGHEVVTVSTAPGAERSPGDRAIAVPPPRITAGVEAVCEPRLARALAHLWGNVALEGAFAGAASRRPPHLVYERYGPFGVAGGVVARAFGAPHVLEVNAPLAREGATWRRQALPEAAAGLERAAFAHASRIVAVSEALREELVEEGAAAEKIAVVPNGVDAELFAPEGPRARVGPPGGRVVGFVGGLRPWHAVEQLAEAFRELASDPSLHLLVVGDGPQARVVDTLARALPGRVTRVQAAEHDEVPRYLRAMDVAVAPYPALDRFYFSPLKVLEYLAAGRAVVASAIGQVPELVREGETGVLVPPGDARALAAAIRRLLEDAPLRAALGAQAAADARSRHGWSERAERILALASAAGARTEAA